MASNTRHKAKDHCPADRSVTDGTTAILLPSADPAGCLPCEDTQAIRLSHHVGNRLLILSGSFGYAMERMANLRRRIRVSRFQSHTPYPSHGGTPYAPSLIQSRCPTPLPASG